MNKNLFLISILGIAILSRVFLLPMGTGDLAIWVADGLTVLEQQSLISIDQFSIHSNLNFLYPARLFNIFVGFIYSLTNYETLIILLRSLFLGFLFWEIRNFIRKKDFNVNEQNIIALGLFGLGSTSFMDRPASLGLIFAYYIIPLLFKESFSKKDIGKIFILCVLWGNIHSSCLIVLPILGYRILIDLIFKKITLNSFIVFITLVFSLIITPEHIKIFEYAYNTMNISGDRSISEWSSALLFKHPSLSILYLVNIGFLTLITNNQNKLKEFLKSPYLPLIFLGFFSVRHVVWSFMLIPALFQHFQLWSPLNYIKFQSQKVNLAIVVGFSLFIIYLSPLNIWQEKENSWYSLDAPVAITKELNEKTDLRIFNQWELGSYLTLKQKGKIFIDTRNIIYSREVFADYRKIVNADDGYQDLLVKYQLNSILMRKEGWPLIAKIRHNNKWKIEREDEHFILLFQK